MEELKATLQEMTQAARQEMELPNASLIIATKGPSLSSTSRIARELADSYGHPLIDENDIARALESIHPTYAPRAKVSPEHFKKLTFEVLYHVASTQLNRQISVTINTTLSDRAYLDRFVTLASSTRVCLIIIECDAQGQHNTGYVVPDHVLKLSVNTQSFSLDEVAPGHDHSMALPLSVSGEPLRDYPSSNVLPQSSASQDEVLKEIDSKKPMNDHLHALVLSEEPKKDKLVCKRCSKRIADQNYYCDECDEFILHKSCAETPGEIKALAQNCPRYLREISPRCESSETRKCSNCDEFSTSCYDCLLETNLHCRFLPPILHRKWHEQPLNFIIIPHAFNYQYLCCACGKLGKSISYKCYDCYYDLHINCVLLPTTVAFKSDKHRLSLSQEDSDEYTCDICKEKGDRSEWLFQCGDCDLAVHIRCMPDLKNSTTTY
ncbi:unnamed protein product [Dovyalis caffra]|uniref:Zinc finger PHD-type domain-containing protein n=1 Tax=Dovyalis caffra TaxID=77055 RepID=A0AAV1R8U8_9ROSI|nr:unnamed protein product [Dovyalis caffra]